MHPYLFFICITLAPLVGATIVMGIYEIFIEKKK